MKKTVLAALTAALLMVFALAGCGGPDTAALLAGADKKLADGDYAGAAAQYQRAAEYDSSGLAYRGLVSSYNALPYEEYGEKLLSAYALLCQSSEAGAADFAAAAQLYIKSGDIASGRDYFEKAYRLSLDPEYSAALSAISVDAAKDSAAVQDMLKSLSQMITAAETDKAAALIGSPEWFSVMLPKLDSGSRRYYMNTEGGSLKVLTGISVNGRHTSLWLINGQSVTYLRFDARGVVSAALTASGNAYEGAFSFESCDAANGSYIKGNGALANGLLIGDCNFSAFIGSAAAAPDALWAGRTGLALTAYSGRFTSAGQPDAASLSYEPNRIFAYTADGKGYLTLPAATGSVTAEAFGIMPLPAWPAE